MIYFCCLCISHNKVAAACFISKSKYSFPIQIFEEPTWDAPLLPGEQELVLPYKNYKGSEKLAPPAAVPEIPGFEPAQITPVKSFTSTFLKKAVSKSGTKKAKR